LYKHQFSPISANWSDLSKTEGNNGVLSASTLIPTSSEVTLIWDQASDAISSTATLEYRVYSSTVSYGESIAVWESLSTEVSGWIANTNTFTISGLNETSAYYFGIIVRDESGNKVIYQPVEMNVFSEIIDSQLTGCQNRKNL
jgi:hypothetical protein